MRVLALAPHTDDVVLGAGGYVSKLIEDGNGVCVLAFSTGNPESGSNVSEFEAAMRELGVGVADVLDYQTRMYPVMRQDILEEIKEQVRMIGPELVIIPARHDHQDHLVVHDEACRVLRSKPISVIAYEQPWNQLMNPIDSIFFAGLEPRHIAKKIKAMGHFKSQDKRPYTKRSYLVANAHRWGVYAASKFAEVFEVVKWVT